MYICEAGHTFEEPAKHAEHHVGANVPCGCYIEYWDVCPECGCEFEEAAWCERGKHWVRDDSKEFVDGWCLDCARSEANSDNLIQDALYYQDWGAEFFSLHYDCQIKKASHELLETLIFDRVNVSRALRNSFLDKLRSWMLDDMSAWITYLNEKEAK